MIPSKPFTCPSQGLLVNSRKCYGIASRRAVSQASSHGSHSALPCPSWPLPLACTHQSRYSKKSSKATRPRQGTGFHAEGDSCLLPGLSLSLGSKHPSLCPESHRVDVLEMKIIPSVSDLYPSRDQTQTKGPGERHIHKPLPREQNISTVHVNGCK